MQNDNSIRVDNDYKELISPTKEDKPIVTSNSHYEIKEATIEVFY